MKPILEKNEIPRPAMIMRLAMVVELQEIAGTRSFQNCENSGCTRLWIGDTWLIWMKAWSRQSAKSIFAFFASGCEGAITTPGGNGALAATLSAPGSLPR